MGDLLPHCQSQKGGCSARGILGSDLNTENSRFGWFAGDLAGFRINLQAGRQAFRPITCRRIARRDLVGKKFVDLRDQRL